MKILKISNLRGMNFLEFPLPSSEGAFLLTGANGVGKSTVLSCLARLGDPGALDRFFTPDIRFRDGSVGNVYEEASVRFETDGHAVEFRYADGQWKPLREADAAEVFSLFGYPRVLFAESKGKRYPLPDETFSVENIRRVPDPVCAAAAEIFDDGKFHHLHTIRSERTGTEFFMIHRFSGGQDLYFSENNFSAGERAVLRLIPALSALPSGSLVLIDESEMALHPKAQKRLLEYLQRAARKQGLTILVSTQSASLIRAAAPKELLFLEKEAPGEFVCRTDVYPAAVLGEMAIVEDILPETILLVEDQEAAMLLDAIVEKLKTCTVREFPFCRILPVGGYMQVVILLDNLSVVFPAYVKRRAVLDKDAEPAIRKAAESADRAHHEIVARNRRRIYFLPCAPEQGVIRLLEGDVKAHSGGLSRAFGCRFLRLEDVVYGEVAYREIPGDSRSDCKEKLSLIVRHIVRLTGEPESFVRKKIYRYYVENHYRDVRKLKSEYCPLIFQR